MVIFQYHQLKCVSITGQCNYFLSDHDIKTLFSEVLAENYLKIKKMKEDPNILWCPFPECQSPFLVKQ
jgi:hypothetical protein